ncbi:MAG TPA: hypothetical protein VF540_00790, partial [Segetibacter sp.]
MKHLLFLVGFLVSLSLLFPEPSSAQDSLSKGGWISVETLAERDSLSFDKRKEGMAVYVTDDSSLYILGKGMTNNNWIVYQSNAVKNRIAFGQGNLTSATITATPFRTYESDYFPAPALRLATLSRQSRFLDNKDGLTSFGIGDIHLEVNLDSLGDATEASTFGKIRLHSYLFPKMNSDIDPEDPANLVSYLSFNKFDNPKRNKGWLQFESNCVDANLNNKHVSEMHLIMQDTVSSNLRQRRILTSQLSYDGTYFATALQGDHLALQKSENEAVYFDFRKNEITVLDTMGIFFDKYTPNILQSRSFNGQNRINLVSVDAKDVISLGNLWSGKGILTDKLALNNYGEGTKIDLLPGSVSLNGISTANSGIQHHVTDGNHIAFYNGGNLSDGRLLLDLHKEGLISTTKLTVNKNSPQYGVDALEVGGKMSATEVRVGQNTIPIYQSLKNPFAIGMDRLIVDGVTGLGIGTHPDIKLRILGGSNSASTYSLVAYSADSRENFSIRDDGIIYASSIKTGA